VREPIILGHEAAGRVVAAGEGTDLAPGDIVALNPSRPCGSCTYCLRGQENHCENMEFRGSAMRMPHVQGLFRDRLVLPAEQCIKAPPDTDLSHLACAEPLAVCLHAANVAGPLDGRDVLITGAGPIGALCAAVARARGAARVVVTDLEDHALSVAEAMGATQCVNVRKTPSAMDDFAAGKGSFDTVFECSAAPPAIRDAIAATRPLGSFVQVGMTGDVTIPLNGIVARELRYSGTFRFKGEFAQAVEAITSGAITVAPMISGAFPAEDAAAAFAMAGDRTKAVKVHLTFAG
ncbi:MAG: zinc-binding dehydrogenase, partial [Pseudomonadota bacterium]